MDIDADDDDEERERQFFGEDDDAFKKSIMSSVPEEPEEVETLSESEIIETKDTTLPEELEEIPEDSLEDEANLNPVGKDA